MRSSFLGAFFALAAVGLGASAQPPTSDQLQALKETLSPDQQQSILQGVLGKGGDGTTKPDANLKTPESVQSKPDEFEFNRRKGKTRDGHYLRQSDEDPELRADDSVIIEMIPLEDLCARLGDTSSGAPAAAANSPSDVQSTLNSLSGNQNSGATSGAKANGPVTSNSFDPTRCARPEDVGKNEDERAD